MARIAVRSVRLSGCRGNLYTRVIERREPVDFSTDSPPGGKTAGQFPAAAPVVNIAAS
jgi:hypothetical protein